MNRGDPKTELPPISNLFPLSEGSIDYADKGVSSTRSLLAIGKRVGKDEVLNRCVMARFNRFREDGLLPDSQIALYLTGVSFMYSALGKEAEKRGGQIAKIEEDVVFMRARDMMRNDENREASERFIQIFEDVILPKLIDGTVDPLDEQSLGRALQEHLDENPEDAKLFEGHRPIFRDQHVTEMLKAVEYLESEPDLLAYFQKGTETNLFFVGAMETYDLFRRNQELENLRRMAQ